MTRPHCSGVEVDKSRRQLFVAVDILLPARRHFVDFDFDASVDERQYKKAEAPGF